MINLQEVLRRSRRFWSQQGCVELWPCAFEIPATTLHPDFYRRLVQGEENRAFCVQPVSRPLDGRAAEHANRLARHLQLSVLLKPPPTDGVPSLFRDFLRVVGFDLERHDIRLAEWNWAAHSIDAWGVGWRVEIDGLGVARLTFVQSVAGESLRPVALEICIGVERLMLALHGAKNVLALPWNDDGASYGSQRRGEEVEHTRYAQTIADIGMLRGVFDLLNGEARRCFEAGAARTAYELAIRQLTWLDRLEARRGLDLEERRQRLERLRVLVLAATDLWLRDRPGELPPDPPAPSLSGTVPSTTVPSADADVDIGVAVDSEDEDDFDETVDALADADMETDMAEVDDETTSETSTSSRSGSRAVKKEAGTAKKTAPTETASTKTAPTKTVSTKTVSTKTAPNERSTKTAPNESSGTKRPRRRPRRRKKSDPDGAGKQDG